MKSIYIDTNKEEALIFKHILKYEMNFTIKESIIILSKHYRTLDIPNIKMRHDIQHKIILRLSDDEYECFLNEKNQNNFKHLKPYINNIILYYINFVKNNNQKVYKYCKSMAMEELDIQINTPKRNLDKREYIDYKYNKKEIDLFNNTILNEEDLLKIKSIQNNSLGTKNYPIVKEIYIMWKNNYTPEEIANVYGKSSRIFQLFLKKNGLSRNRFEAQAIAKTKRDYKSILTKGRKTLLDRNTLIYGSIQENYLRELLNCELALRYDGFEIIVGINNKSILLNGKEIDIPIFILKNDMICKIAVEYNGDFWHKNRNEESKYNIIEESGYKLFIISPNKNATEKQIREYINQEVESICKYIDSFFYNK